jgi:uncharacterized protein (DUF3084 family)
MDKERREHQKVFSEKKAIEIRLEAIEKDKKEAEQKHKALQERYQRLTDDEALQTRNSGAPEAAKRVE